MSRRQCRDHTQKAASKLIFNSSRQKWSDHKAPAKLDISFCCSDFSPPLFPTPCTLPRLRRGGLKKKAQAAVENPFLNFKVASEPRLSLSLPSEIQEKAVCRCREHRELTALFVSSAPSLPTPALARSPHRSHFFPTSDRFGG